MSSTHYEASIDPGAGIDVPKNVSPMIELGATGLRRTAGYIDEEFLPQLRGRKAVQIYREMADNDPTVGAIIFAISMLIRRVKWTVQAADDSGKADDGKTFLEEVIKDMTHPMSSVMSEVCSMFVYGYAPLEILWKIRGGMDTNDKTKRSKFDDGKIGIRALSLRAQPTILAWEFDEEDGEVIGLKQQPWSGTIIDIPMEKVVLFRTTDEKGNPEGRSVLRNAYRPWSLKKRIEEIEGIGIERDLAGLPVARIPLEYFDPAADAQQKATLAAWGELVKRVRRDSQEGILLPSDRDEHGQLLYDFTLLNSGGSRQVDTTRVITRYDQAIASSVLADFVLLGQKSAGSFALSDNKTELFATAMDAFLEGITDTFNRQLLPRLWKLNGMDYEMMPTLAHGDLKRQDLQALGAFISSMAGAGAPMFPDRELENHLRDIAGLPPAPEDGSNMPDVPMPGQRGQMPGQLPDPLAGLGGQPPNDQPPPQAEDPKDDTQPGKGKPKAAPPGRMNGSGRQPAPKA